MDHLVQCQQSNAIKQHPIPESARIDMQAAQCAHYGGPVDWQLTWLQGTRPALAAVFGSREPLPHLLPLAYGAEAHNSIIRLERASINGDIHYCQFPHLALKKVHV